MMGEEKKKPLNLVEYFANATKNKSTSDSINVIMENLKNGGNPDFLNLVKNPEIELVANRQGRKTITPKVKLTNKGTSYASGKNSITINPKQEGLGSALDLLSVIQHEEAHPETATVDKNGKLTYGFSRVNDNYYNEFSPIDFESPIKTHIDITSILGSALSKSIAKKFKERSQTSPSALTANATYLDYYPGLFDPIESLAYGVSTLNKGKSDIDKTTDQYKILENNRKIYRNNLLWYFKQMGMIPK
jgi:hypothetical protein